MNNPEQTVRQAIRDAIANGDESAFNRASAELRQILDNKPRAASAPVVTRKFDV